MKFTRFALLAVAATAGLVACEKDITASGGEPYAIVTDVTQATTPRNTQLSIRAFTIDQNNRRIPGALSASAISPVSIDSTVYVPELSETRIFVRGTAAQAAPGADVTITGHGLTATSRIIVQ